MKPLFSRGLVLACTIAHAGQAISNKSLGYLKVPIDYTAKRGIFDKGCDKNNEK
jgi:hypothetical protein